MKFSVNLSTVFTEYPFLQRFEKAKEFGFSYVECQFPYDFDVEDIKGKLEEHSLSLVLINLPPGNWDKGERGLAADPNRQKDFLSSVEQGIFYAKALNVKNIHCMAGLAASGSEEIYIENVRMAARMLAEENLTLLIEPINDFDMPGYFLSDLHEAGKIIEKINEQNVKLQFDFYHIQRMHGNLLDNFKKYKNMIGHVQIADVPGRHEPGTGEIHFRNVLKRIVQEGYGGYIGLEYTPKGKSEESFQWLEEMGRK